jgi:acetyltransferase
MVCSTPVLQSDAMPTLANSRPRPYAGRRPPPRNLHERNTAPAPTGEVLHARDGTTLQLRPIHADDTCALQRGFRHLTADEVRMRFLHPLTDLPDEFAQRLCDLDPHSGVAYVLIDPPSVREPEIHAVARAHIDLTTLVAEFAIVVQNRFAGQGFGKLLMQRVVDACRARGATELWGDVFLENGAMLALCDHLGCTRRSLEHEPGVVRVTLDLTKA